MKANEVIAKREGNRLSKSEIHHRNVIKLRLFNAISLCEDFISEKEDRKLSGLYANIVHGRNLLRDNKGTNMELREIEDHIYQSIVIEIETSKERV